MLTEDYIKLFTLISRTISVKAIISGVWHVCQQGGDPCLVSLSQCVRILLLNSVSFFISLTLSPPLSFFGPKTSASFYLQPLKDLLARMCSLFPSQEVTGAKPWFSTLLGQQVGPDAFPLY